MRIFDSWWSSVVYFFDLATFSSFSHTDPHQQALLKDAPSSNFFHGSVIQPIAPPADNTALSYDTSKGPIFDPPYPPDDMPGPGVAIKCDYSRMSSDWTNCSSPESRGCWLRGPKGEEYNIKTDYEKYAPLGIKRKYFLDITEKALVPDGIAMPYGKVFNNTYPGPWIQACWGDELEITVRNQLRFNGTTIHWHGIRQLDNVEMDGVNGLTQCPIAPGQEFTYKFNVTQYGSSWYHSHYSLQYADGLLGPMTIYGPSSDNYAYAQEPILMTDWNHRSAFEDWSYSIQPGNDRPRMTNILLNGKGRYVDPATNETVVDTKRYTKILKKGTRYLLRLINTSVDTTFIFAIDGHNLTVIGSDFVSLKTPYNTNSVLVGIGQRYHVILTADPIKPTKDDNTGSVLYRPTGVGRKIFINPSSPYDSNIPTACSDEPYESLAPMVEWIVESPSNGNVEQNHTYDVGLQGIQGHPYQPSYDRSLWNIDNMPLWLRFGDPTVLNLNTPNGSWPTHLDVTTHNPKRGEWIYLVITASNSNLGPIKHPDRLFVPVAHPIHLHGHDFAILNQSSTPYPGFNNVVLNKNNPPRRDVALLPQDGYLVIAFRADNPGTWLLHCHIAWHASSGLGMQILENKKEIMKRLGGDKKKSMLVNTCEAWNDWVSDTRNHYNPRKPNAFQDDSGI